MAILKILEYPDPRLHKVASPVPAVSVARRTPPGSVTRTAPLRRKKLEAAGVPAVTMLSPAL